MRKIFLPVLFILLGLQLTAQNITGYEYWFDNDFASKSISSISPKNTVTLNLQVPTGALQTGIHVLSMRFESDGKKYSNTLSQFFYKTTPGTSDSHKIDYYEYWIDNYYNHAVRANTANAELIRLDQLVEADTLRTGIHAFHIRFSDNTKEWSSVASQYFYKAPPGITDTKAINSYEYWMDNDYAKAVKGNITSSELIRIDQLAQADTLRTGIHAFHIRFRDNAKEWSSVASQYFYKAPPGIADTKAINSYEYWIDNDYAKVATGNISVAEVIALDQLIQCDTLRTGIHALHIRFRDNAKEWSNVVSQYFYKQPILSMSGNNVTLYRYWIDDGFSEAIGTSTEGGIVQLQLATDLNLHSIPNGKHVIHLQFRDAMGYWSSVCSDSITVDHDNTGISSINEFGIRVWPNPTSGTATIDLGGMYNHVQLSIADLSANVIETNQYTNCNTVKIELYNRPAGVYIVSIKADEKIARIKLMKK